MYKQLVLIVKIIIHRDCNKIITLIIVKIIKSQYERNKIYW